MRSPPGADVISPHTYGMLGLVGDAATVASEALVGTGWTTPTISTTNRDNIWAALASEALNPGKLGIDVSNVLVLDGPDHWVRSMTIDAMGKSVQDHIYINEHKGEFVYRLVDPDTSLETDDERVIAIKENPLRMELFHRRISNGHRLFWEAPIHSVQLLTQKLAEYASNLKGQ